MMSRNRPATTGYERLAQADHFSDESDDEPLSQSVTSLQPQPFPRFEPATRPRAHSGAASPKAPNGQKRSRKHQRRNSGVDLKAINARLERWADEIASKFKRAKSKQTGEGEQPEIHYSVFHPVAGVRPATAETLAAMPEPAMSKAEFDQIVKSVRVAIDQGMHPSMITQGSSGSYFARNTDGKIVGVFKPKDEEPYAAGNPKWNKWIHRNLFPCCFGRTCLIPNLSYVSEAAAYTLDCQLRTNMVPYTDVIWLSSKSFHYPYWDRRKFFRKKKPLPAKPGSFQVFLKGYKDANIFLREHPWPDQHWSGFRPNDTHRNRRKRWGANCQPSHRPAYDEFESDDEQSHREQRPLGPDNFKWTESLKQSFREELEKLVILDYIMRNTDRGLDNWMVKVDWEALEVSIASEPPRFNMNIMDEEEREEAPRPVDLTQRPQPTNPRSQPYRVQKPMNANGFPEGPTPNISIGAIDNSLSWPWKHPDAWRSFPFGWLFLPVDLIGRPFSQKTRDHFLPLLTSTTWWSQTSHQLRKVFQIDPDFQEKMFSRQMAVMKGQAWNVVETLKMADHGPLELTRRARVCVWDDLVDVPVAVPLRMASSELRRKAGSEHPDVIQEEMDIGAANSSSLPAKHVGDSLSPPGLLPHPDHFELATGPGTQSPEEHGNSSARGSSDEGQGRPSMNGSGLRSSYQGPTRTATQTTSPQRYRRYSFAAAQRHSSTIAQQMYASTDSYGDFAEDDVEGDLGYAAAEGMEGNRRKVIVERLETVKARNPVFTWC